MMQYDKLKRKCSPIFEKCIRLFIAKRLALKVGCSIKNQYEFTVFLQELMVFAAVAGTLFEKETIHNIPYPHRKQLYL